jgi:hypothetical protein
MSIMKAAFAFAILLSTLFGLPAFADDKPQAAVNASNKDAFETVSGWVRKQMEPGGRYSYVTPADQKKVDSELDEMGKLFQQRGDVEHMTDAEKKSMFVNQQDVNAILAKHDNERVICKNEAPIGSHIPVKTCQTAGMIEARRRNDVQYMQQSRGQSVNGK